MPAGVTLALTHPSGAAWYVHAAAPGGPPHEIAYSFAAHWSVHVAVPLLDEHPSQLVVLSEMQSCETPDDVTPGPPAPPVTLGPPSHTTPTGYSHWTNARPTVHAPGPPS